MNDSPETPSQASGSYCMAKTPGKTEEKKEEEKEKKEKAMKHKENKKRKKTQENIHFAGLNERKATSKSIPGEESKKPETSVGDLPSPQEGGEEEEPQETKNHQNADDRREEMHEAMVRTRKDAETGSEIELALTPKGSAQSDE